MKKIILSVFMTLLLVSCEENKQPDYKHYKDSKTDTEIAIIDGCEYIVNREKYAYAYTENSYVTYTHKGNCKYCAERRKKELEEIIKQIKNTEP